MEKTIVATQTNDVKTAVIANWTVDIARGIRFPSSIVITILATIYVFKTFGIKAMFSTH